LKKEEKKNAKKEKRKEVAAGMRIPKKHYY